jgi:hypothetical protein
MPSFNREQAIEEKNMAVHTYKPEVTTTYSYTQNWSSGQSYQPSTWVHLLEPLSPLSFDEALLLCQHSENEWIAWVPDHGEIILNTSQFCLS